MNAVPAPKQMLLTKSVMCLDCFEQTDIHYWTHEPPPELKCEKCGSTNVEEE